MENGATGKGYEFSERKCTIVDEDDFSNQITGVRFRSSGDVLFGKLEPLFS